MATTALPEIQRRRLLRVNHEAAHAVVAAALGLRVTGVSIDSTPNEPGGHCSVVPDMQRLDAHLRAVIVGPLGEHAPLSWPPGRDSGGDEATAAALCERLGITDEQDWNRLHRDVTELLHSDPVNAAVVAIGGHLLQRGFVSGDEVAEIVRGAGVRVASGSVTQTPWASCRRPTEG